MLHAVRKKPMKIKSSPADIVFDVFKIVILALFVIIIVFPMLNVLSLAVSNGVYNANITFFPRGWTFAPIKYVLTDSAFIRSFLNSLLLTVVVTLASNIFMSMAAYPLSKEDCPCKKGIMLFFVIVMLFSAGILPGYLLMRTLKLTNTIWSVVLVSITNVYNMLLFKTNFEGLPSEVEEAARIDGASSIQLFFRIVIPLSLPIFASCIFFTIVGTWNSYGGAVMYIDSAHANAQPLALYLYRLLTATDSSMDSWMITNKSNVQAATILVSLIPILLIYPYVIKYIKSGLTIGSVKG